MVKIGRGDGPVSEKKVVPILPPRPTAMRHRPRAMIDPGERGMIGFHGRECSQRRGLRLLLFRRGLLHHERQDFVMAQRLCELAAQVVVAVDDAIAAHDSELGRQGESMGGVKEEDRKDGARRDRLTRQEAAAADGKVMHPTGRFAAVRGSDFARRQTGRREPFARDGVRSAFGWRRS